MSLTQKYPLRGHVVWQEAHQHRVHWETGDPRDTQDGRSVRARACVCAFVVILC